LALGGEGREVESKDSTYQPVRTDTDAAFRSDCATTLRLEDRLADAPTIDPKAALSLPMLRCLPTGKAFPQTLIVIRSCREGNVGATPGGGPESTALHKGGISSCIKADYDENERFSTAACLSCSKYHLTMDPEIIGIPVCVRLLAKEAVESVPSPQTASIVKHCLAIALYGSVKPMPGIYATSSQDHHLSTAIVIFDISPRQRP